MSAQYSDKPISVSLLTKKNLNNHIKIEIRMTKPFHWSYVFLFVVILITNKFSRIIKDNVIDISPLRF